MKFGFRKLFALFALNIFVAFQLKNACGQQVVVFDSMTMIPCGISQDYPAPITGESVFSSAHISAASVQEIQVSMWVFPKGYRVSEYTLFSIYALTPTPTPIVQLKYKIGPPSQIYGLLKGILTNVETYLSLGWNFLQILVSLSPTTGGQDDLLIKMSIQQSTTIKQMACSPSSALGSVQSFQRSQILFYFGFGSTSSVPENAGCSSLRYAAIDFNFPTTDWQTTSFGYKQQLTTSLLIHYDLFYTLTNLMTLITAGSYFSRLTDLQLETSIGGSSVQLQNKKKLEFGSFSLIQKGGMIVYFEFKSLSDTEIKTILQLSFDDNSSYSMTIKLVQKSNCKLFLDNTELFSLQQYTWYQIAFVISRSSLAATDIKVLFPETISQSDFILASGYQRVNVSFGGLSTDGQIQFDNFRFYQGTRFYQTSACLFQVEGEENDCLICKSGQLLSYQKNKVCIPSQIGDSATKSRIIDWPRLDCPLDMMHSRLTTTCYCPYQTYRVGDSCVKCPDYCRGCTSPKHCIESDINRDLLTGKCNNNLFDDGYNCIKRTFSIPERKNFINDILVLGDFRIYLSASDLQISGSTNSIFFAIQILTGMINPVTLQTIAKFIDNGTQLITITLQEIAPEKANLISLYAGSPLSLVNQFQTPLGDYVWVGVYVSQTKILFIVESIRDIQFYSQAATLLTSITSPLLCLGDCDSNFTYDSSKLSTFFTYYQVKYQQVKYIRGMTDPIDFMNDFLRLFTSRSTMYLHFNSENSVFDPSQIDIPNSASNPTFPNNILSVLSPLSLHSLKGVQMQANSYTTTANFPVYNELSMSLSVFIVRLNYEVCIFQFLSDTQPIKLWFIPENFRNQVYIRVQHSNDILQTKYCTLKLNQPNFLALIQRFYILSSSQIQFEVEVVCDFCRETLTFWIQKPYNYNNVLKSDIKFFGNTVADFYINNIKFFERNEFYFDYSETDPCFLYYDLENMKCIKTKKGYALRTESKIVLQDECRQGPGETKWIYNKYTGYCQDTKSSMDCAVYNEADLSCLKCTDPFGDTNNSCDCLEGYYFEPKMQSCQECLNQCKSCKSSLECLECKGTNTLSPDCHCSKTNQYATTSFSCENCSTQCETCDLQPDNCIKCSENRIEPPKCGCDPQYFNLNASTPSNCVPFVCSNKCDTCEYSSDNCVICQAQRSNPPECKCEGNQSEMSDGTCSACSSDSFYDKINNVCTKCDSRCLKCLESATKCIECYDSLILYKSTCLCTDYSPFLLDEQGEINCATGMNASLKTQSSEGIYEFVFTFEQELEVIDFNETEIDMLVFIYFNSLESKYFAVSQSKVIENQLILSLEFYSSFYAQKGSVIFLQNLIFKSSTSTKILDKKYLVDPLEFNIGSFVLKNGLYTASETSRESLALVQNLSNESQIFNIIKQLQLAFYLINTLQPTVIYLLVDIQLPPNLSTVLQFFGALVFPKIQNFGLDQEEESSRFSLFQKELELNKDISKNSKPFLRRLGLSNSIFVSMPLTFIQFLFFSCASMFTYLIQFAQNKEPPTVKKASIFLLKRMNACFEGGLLIIVGLSCNQFENIFSEQLINRLSLYIAGVCIIAILVIYWRSYFSHNTKGQPEDQIEILKKLRNSKISLNYLNMQFCKKIMMAVLVVTLIESPNLICYTLTFIILSSLIVTIIMRPYKSLLQNVIKILGEACQLVVWAIFSFIFIPFDQDLRIAQHISDNEVEKYLLAGKICLFALLAFSLLYIIEFIASIVITIIEYRKTKKQQPIEKIMKLKKPAPSLTGQFAFVFINQQKKGLEQIS